ncbi:hypothetical protein [Tomitella biformata]|uniref:hypothetical protein n=1 Tax=Tomitella biformata TaxID=630403 RepID=UPI000466A7BE|nr:hypothetical protein [Tomitella biformata]
MGVNHLTPYSASSEERAAVTASLKSALGPWVEVPSYDIFSRKSSHNKLDAVYRTVTRETNSSQTEAADAYRASQVFIDKIFDMYESRNSEVLGRKVDRAFVVPMRSDRRDESYASESTPFVPLLDPVRFGVDSEIRMRTLYGFPPLVLDTYLRSEIPGQSGALVLAPMYVDMTADLRPDRGNKEQNQRLIGAAAHILNETVTFATNRLGANLIGLGAILPKLTNFGRAISDLHGTTTLTTTTGHGGTVWMISEIVKKLCHESFVENNGRVGIIGAAGSIGSSTLDVLLASSDNYHVHAFDTRNEALSRMAETHPFTKFITVEGSAFSVLTNTSIVVAATTTRIDLDDIDQYCELDLRGTVIVDDSQPGCFDKAQVERRGGKLVWVVGSDGSDSQFLTRDGFHTNGEPYNYGDNSGLWGPGSEFPCGQEVGVIASTFRYEKSINSQVTPQKVHDIGNLLVECGVEVAPFQSFGQPVAV